MSSIEIRNFEADDKTYFTTKNLRFNHNTLQTPFKSLDFNYLGSLKELKLLEKKWLDRNSVIEKSRLIRYDTFKTEIDKSDTPFLSENYDLYKKIPVLSDKLIINTLTLTFNPCQTPKYEEEITNFLDIYHGRSDILFVPNLKVKKTNPDTKKIEWITDSKDYLNYVYFAYDTLKFRNSKPIFVPISTRYGKTKFIEIAKDLIESGHRYFWFDLEGRASTSFTTQLRSFFRIVDDEGLDDKIVLYGTNIQRELSPHKSDSASAASDILATPMGLDFVGVNREPQHGPMNIKYIPPPKEEIAPHKGRFFNSNTYEYIKYTDYPDSDLMMKKYNIEAYSLIKNPKLFSNFANSFELNLEFERQKYAMQYDNCLKDYLSEKRSITSNTLESFEKDAKEPKSKNHTLNDYM